LIYASFEGFSYLCLWVLKDVKKISYDPIASELSVKQKKKLARLIVELGENLETGFDPVLGWVGKGKKNSSGIRDDLEYAPSPPPGKIRITTFGDSFTYGSDVLLHESWGKQLVALNPSLQVLNYGVPAYGMDQAYLRYLRVKDRDNPHIVFIGYMTENLARHVNVFRPFYSRSYGRVIFTKPRFRLLNGKLNLFKNPIDSKKEFSRFLNNDSQVLTELGDNDYHYQTGYIKGWFDFLPSVRFIKIVWSEIKKIVQRPIFTSTGMYHEKSEALQLTNVLFDTFYKEVLIQGALPVILIFPDWFDQNRSRARKPRRYQALLDTLQSKGYRYIDVLDALTPVEKDYSVKDLTVAWGHYSPLGSRIVAEYLSNRLKDSGLFDIYAIEKKILEEQERLGIKGNLFPKKIAN
jgi:hypothetical protein